MHAFSYIYIIYVYLIDMCGVTAILSNNKLNDIIINSLKALQNRGYDSCGVIDNKFTLLREIQEPDTDSIEKLSKQINVMSESNVIIGHTRWATSGKKTLNNTHPHLSYDNKIAVVHNGIVENYEKLKKELHPIPFRSETDTEVISNWIANKCKTSSLMETLEECIGVFQGSWAFVLIHKDYPESIFLVRHGNPLLIGYNTTNNDIMVCSELAGFVNNVNKYYIVENNKPFALSLNEKLYLNFLDVPKEEIMINPDKFPYFMAKEIYDQKDIVNNPCNWAAYKEIKNIPELKELEKLKKKLSDNGLFDILIIACGTSYHSGLSSKYFFHKKPFRSFKCIVAPELTEYDLPEGNQLAIFISQSGETLDTYKALKLVKNKNIPTLSIVNVENSLIARESDYRLYLHAGREVGVASTKAYVSQIIALNLLSLYFKNKNITDDYHKLSSQITKILHDYFPYQDKNGKYELKCQDIFKNVITDLNIKNNGFTLSTGFLKATSNEAALKIKELARVFVQGYPTASLKHGPFALIEDGTPILFTLEDCNEDIIKKTNSTIDEVYLRNANIYMVTDIQDYKNDKIKNIIKVPRNKTFSSILTIIPYQIISYFLSLERGLNCDKPVNLAKCVTTD